MTVANPQWIHAFASSPAAQADGSVRCRDDLVNLKVMEELRLQPTAPAQLRTVPGIGPVLSATLLASLPAMVREGLTWQQTRVGQGQFLTITA